MPRPRREKVFLKFTTKAKTPRKDENQLDFFFFFVFLVPSWFKILSWEGYAQNTLPLDDVPVGGFV